MFSVGAYDSWIVVGSYKSNAVVECVPRELNFIVDVVILPFKLFHFFHVETFKGGNTVRFLSLLKAIIASIFLILALVDIYVSLTIIIISG